MKKKNIKSLKLNKKSISNLDRKNEIVGGFNTISCHPVGVCCPTHDVNCPTENADCGATAGCPPPTDGCPPSGLGCVTFSCPGAGIC